VLKRETSGRQDNNTEDLAILGTVEIQFLLKFTPRIEKLHLKLTSPLRPIART
jgi:hypothetical protein